MRGRGAIWLAGGLLLLALPARAQAPEDFPGCEWRTVAEKPALFCPSGRLTWRRITSDGEFSPLTIEKARAGDVRAKALLGIALARRTPGRPHAGLALVRQAADQGDALAMRKLASWLEGDDNAEAMRLYRRAAELGDAPAMTALGDAYSFGQLAEFDEAQQLVWYRRAAEAGDLSRVKRLVDLLPDGDPDARRWLTAGAEAGNVEAMHHLAWGYEGGRFGLAKDAAQGAAWRARAAAAEVAGWKAQIDAALDLVPAFLFANDGGPAKKLGDRYLERPAPDPAEAIKWYVLGAEHGDPEAAEALASLYQFGREGVRRDRAEARRWRRRWEDLALDQLTAAAEAGWPGQMHQLAEFHLTGGGFHSAHSGRGRDPAEGVRWARQALADDPGDVSAMVLLAHAYREGLGVAKDAAEAGRLQARAVALDPDSLAPLETLVAGMPGRPAEEILYFALRHYAEGARDEAVFWFLVARLRAQLEIAKGATLPQGVENGFHVTWIKVNEHATGNIPKYVATIDRALAWDDAHSLPDTPADMRAQARTALVALKDELKRDAGEIRRLRREQGLPATTR